MVVEKDTWFIAHNNTIFHPGHCKAGESFDTGMPILEEFDNEEEWKARAIELNIDLWLIDPDNHLPPTGSL